MTKKQITKLVEQANNAIVNVPHALRTLTADKPLILFDKDKIDTKEGVSSDEIYDFPIGYYVGKHGDYLQGVVMKVEGDNVTLFLTGEEFGDIWHQYLSDLPFETLVDLLEILMEEK